MTTLQPDKKLAAVCGLFCPSCTYYIGSAADPARLKRLAERSGHAIEEIECHGCRSDTVTFYCRSCKMVQCAAEKGLDFCGQCADYPCADLREFQAARPHRLELWAAQARIQEAGYEQWFTEMVEHYACPQCHTLNSVYDLVCRNCGANPGSAYVAQHKEQILQFLAGRK